MKRSTILIVAFGLLFSACRKSTELPASDPGEPVFYLKAKLEGNSFVVSAGDNGYYMHTSVYQNENDIYVFQGDLNSDCSSSCGYSLSVLLNDTKVSAHGAPLKEDSALMPGKYMFLDRANLPTQQLVSFVPKDAFSPGSTYAWQIVDKNGVIASSSSYSFSTTLPLASQYTVNYSFQDVSGVCQGSHSNVCAPGSAFKTWMSSNKSGNTVTVTAQTDETGVYSYTWDFGDGSTGSGKTAVHQYAAYGKYRVKLTTSDGQNSIAVCYYEVNTQPDACENNFITKYTPLDYSKVLKTITFVLKDPSGKVYSSADAGITSDSYCEVLQVDEYDQNTMGKPTKRLHLRFSCKLKGTQGEIELEDAEAFIGVAY